MSLGYDPHAAAERVKALMAERGFATNVQLAQHMGVNPSELTRLTNPAKYAEKLGPMQWQRFAVALETSVDWLLHGVGPQDVEPPRKVSLEDVLQAVRDVHLDVRRIYERFQVPRTEQH